MPDEPDRPVLGLLRGIRATQVEHTAALARLPAIERHILAIEMNITRIRRENAGDAETAIVDLDQRLSQLEQRARQQDQS